MSKFSEALNSIANGIKDMTSLEVVTYKGTIKIAADEAVPTEFDKIIGKAKGTADFQITACTYVELDGDMKIFYDNDITSAERDSHNSLVDVARKNRQAVVDLFKDAILKDISGL